jgi:threonine aldolase
MIDLRSDTVTRPTAVMREAMAEAEVGDDVYGEDPTVNRLQAMAADRLGMEAALLVPSGTMGNLASLLAHCGRGDEVIIGDKSHTFLYEQGGMAALGGIMPHTVPNRPDGTMALDAIEGAIRGDDAHFPRTRLVCLENTHNACNGSPIPPETVAEVADLAHANGLRVHIDGARLFNAAVALDVPASDLVASVDSVTFCLSKGLWAPVGSLICGSEAFIGEVHRARKVLGGGMRQAGVVAAAGIVALEQMVDRLAEDHARARRLAEGFKAIPGLEVGPVHTNIFYFSISESCPLTGAEVAAGLKARGVLLPNRTARGFRAVTHCWIDDAAIEKALIAMREVMAEAG